MIGGRRPLRPLRPPAPRRLRRRRPWWPVLVVAAPLAGWLAWRAVDDGAATQAAPPDMAFDAPVGQRITGARCFMVVVDESASMADADGTGARADAVAAARDFLAAHGLADDRIGVTWFADSADVEGPALASVGASTSAPGDLTSLGTGTNIASALQQTVEAQQRGCASAKPVIVLVSDGQASGDAQFELTAEALKGAGTGLDVHLIAMNGNAAFESARAFWSDPALGLDSIETVTSFGRGEVAAAMAQILTLETGQQVGASGADATKATS